MKDERNQCARPFVLIEDFLKIDVGEDVHVDDRKRFLVPEIFHVFDPSSGTQNLRFHPCFDLYAGERMLPNIIHHLLMVMMGVDDDFRAAVVLEVINAPFQDGLVGNRHERFRPLVRERAKSCAEPGCQDHGFHGL